MSTNKTLRDALQGLLDSYISGVESGDWGNWDPEKEEAVIAARAALSASEGAAPVAAEAATPEDLEVYQGIADNYFASLPNGHADTWAEYVAGMILCYLDGKAVDESQTKAVAGIIRRRLRSLATAPQPAVNGAGLSDAAAKAIREASSYASAFHGELRVVPLDQVMDILAAQARPVALSFFERVRSMLGDPVEGPILRSKIAEETAPAAPPAEAMPAPAAEAEPVAADAPAEVAEDRQAMAVQIIRLVAEYGTLCFRRQDDERPSTHTEVNDAEAVLRTLIAALAAPVEVQEAFAEAEELRHITTYLDGLCIPSLGEDGQRLTLVARINLMTARCVKAKKDLAESRLQTSLVLEKRLNEAEAALAGRPAPAATWECPECHTGGCEVGKCHIGAKPPAPAAEADEPHGWLYQNEMGRLVFVPGKTAPSWSWKKPPMTAVFTRPAAPLSESAEATNLRIDSRPLVELVHLSPDGVLTIDAKAIAAIAATSAGEGQV